MVREEIFDEEMAAACIREVEAIEAFCASLRVDIERRHAAGVGDKARSIGTRVNMLLELGASALAVERWEEHRVAFERGDPGPMRLPVGIVCCETCGHLTTRDVLERMNPAQRRCQCGGHSWKKFIDPERGRKLGLDKRCRKCPRCGDEVHWYSVRLPLAACSKCGFSAWEIPQVTPEDPERLPPGIFRCTACARLINERFADPSTGGERGRCPDCGSVVWSETAPLPLIKCYGLDEPNRRCACGAEVPWTALEHLLSPCPHCGNKDWTKR